MSTATAARAPLLLLPAVRCVGRRASSPAGLEGLFMKSALCSYDSGVVELLLTAPLESTTVSAALSFGKSAHLVC
jgi:hypothetical protein